MHRETGSTRTYIIEYGFLDTKLDDVEQIKTYWKDYAEAVVEAFCVLYGKPYTKPVNTDKVMKQILIVQKELDKLKELI